MAGKQRQYQQRIRSTQSLKKIFRAMELIAASRIGKARERVTAASPYAHALTRAISAVASHADIEHPLTTERADTKRAAILVITADRGMAGAYSVNAIRESERLRAQLLEAGKDVAQYVTGRRGVSYFNFRHRDVERAWTGASDAPAPEIASEISRTLLDAFLARAEDGGLAEIHIVYTQFRSMVAQQARVLRLVPLVVVEGEMVEGEQVLPLYAFEPGARQVLDALLPRYIEARIYACLLQSAASELAARQRAMNTATTNAEEMIRTYTRLSNQARQSEITQEISEIVSGADALASVS
jgi:F-type H+-transporting ATPase subunit gamma